MESLIPASINLTILICFLFFKLRQPLRQFTLQRHQTIHAQVVSAQNQLHEAQEKYSTFVLKLKTLDHEMKELLEQMKRDSVEVKDRLMTEASHLARMLTSDAESSVLTLFLEFKGDLYTDLSHRVLTRAELILKEQLTQEDRSRMQQGFSKELEQFL